jgi:hypothetical protein
MAAYAALDRAMAKVIPEMNSRLEAEDSPFRLFVPFDPGSAYDDPGFGTDRKDA